MSQLEFPAHDARTRVVRSVRDTVRAVNALQDRIVATYFEPHAVTLTYWALAFVFLYIGLQKVVPHRSAADVQLATIGGIIGIPYITFVTLVGSWQLLIGALFLLRRLRLCAWFFFSYQVFTFSTLVVLRKIVFQPPWITVFGIEIPWALGAYAAFILKNVIFAAIFFVLATQEVDTGGDTADETSGSASSNRPVGSRLSRLGSLASGTRIRRLFVSEGGVTRLLPGRVVKRSRRGTADRHRVGRLFDRIRTLRDRLIERSHAAQNHFVRNYFRPHGVSILYWSYGFIWFYFGLQKPAPVYSPVRHPLSEFFPHFGIPLAEGMVFIGLFEMFLGLLFFFREIRVAFWLFFGHQAVTLFTLAVIPFVAFQPPYVSLFGVRFPWALTGYGAFVIKNVVFIAGFTLLASIELGDLTVDGYREEPTRKVEVDRAD